jgi:CheY-like chemotaxis protein
LIVDDDPDVRALLRTVLELATDFDCYEAADGYHALESWRSHQQDIVVLDQSMPGLTGLDVAEGILEISPAQPVVLFSAYLDAKIREDAKRMGVRLVLGKDQFDTLVIVLQEADQEPPRSR